ncbi:MAG: twin-arginine translocase TatA/TatE family subunit [Actinomycetota bacterium]
MGGIGPPELLIILVILLLLFGGKKLPELANSIGTSLREFRKASEEADADGSSKGTTDESSSTDPETER